MGASKQDLIGIVGICEPPLAENVIAFGIKNNDDIQSIKGFSPNIDEKVLKIMIAGI